MTARVISGRNLALGRLCVTVYRFFWSDAVNVLCQSYSCFWPKDFLTMSWWQSINLSLIPLSDLKFWKCHSATYKQTRWCTRSCTRSLEPQLKCHGAAAHWGRCWLYFFQSLCSCPFQLCPSSQVTAPGKEQQSLLWVLLYYLCHPSKRRKKTCVFSVLSLALEFSEAGWIPICSTRILFISKTFSFDCQ